MTLKNVEISLEQAAILLELHTRTIRNLIQRRELKACKVKGRWYLDKASVMALKDKALPFLAMAEPSAPM
jgi:excisionase family DNA binding protein